jgi:DNA modification methylase
MLNKIYHGDCLEVMRQWPPECVDMCVTSPPYWGLRDYGIEGQLGLEKTPEEYIEKLVEIFREVRRALKPWGSVWLNLGDSYASAWACGRRNIINQGSCKNRIDRVSQGLKEKDLCMMPARVALALQAAGWWLRSDIIWAKPNPMPESVTDRPTSSYEHVFLLTKNAKYFYDAEAVRETSITGDSRKPYGSDGAWEMDGRDKWEEGAGQPRKTDASNRNLRNVWTINTQPYPEAHYATFPEELPRRCILAGTSAKGNCAECGKPWVRVVEKDRTFESGSGKSGNLPAGKNGPNLQGGGETIDVRRGPCVHTETVGWQPSCTCNADTVPAVVLDPFFGSGTVGVVAEKLQRDWIGIEISREYIEGQAKIRTGLSTSEELVKDKPLFNCDDCGKPSWLHE